MGVDVPLYASSSHSAYVYADIETTRVKYLLQDFDTSTNYLKVLMKLFRGQSFEAGNMPIRGYHQMPWIIGIAIQNDEVFASSIQNIVLSIIVLPGFFT
jgi:hypothetical protein